MVVYLTIFIGVLKAMFACIAGVNLFVGLYIIYFILCRARPNTSPRVVSLNRRHYFEQCPFSGSILAGTEVLIHPAFSYVINLKAGFSTTRRVFRDTNVTFHRTRAGAVQQWPPFTFTLVREPVQKFESGIRQARTMKWPWQVNTSLHSQLLTMSMDDIVRLQISMYQDRKKKNDYWDIWLDPHLLPNTQRLTGIQYDFIGTLEQFTESMFWIMQNIEHVHEYDWIHDIKKRNVRPKEETISPEVIQEMCTSELFRHEWECFGYDLPSACTEHSAILSS